MKFGLSDYIAMYKKRGIRLPFNYFFENHLFDIINGTETHTWLPKENFKETPKNFEHGVIYMSSWTSIVKGTTNYLLKNFSLNIEDCAFIDIGCGKGKVLCVWSKIFSNRYNTLLVGLDYSKTLLQICENNLRAVSATNYKLLNCDATEEKFDYKRQTNIFYLYNPFDEVVLEKVIQQMKSQNCLVIYNNPQCKQVFIDNRFSIVKEQKEWHPNADYVIFSNLG
jgi:precorrin-6B methylase 2